MKGCCQILQPVHLAARAAARLAVHAPRRGSRTLPGKPDGRRAVRDADQHARLDGSDGGFQVGARGAVVIVAVRQRVILRSLRPARHQPRLSTCAHGSTWQNEEARPACLPSLDAGAQTLSL